MQMTFRWFGTDDPVTLANIRQIPGVEGIVTALPLPVGERWPRDRILECRDRIAGAGLRWAVVESLAVHEDIKLGAPGRERLIEHYLASVEAIGAAGIPVICYNFMPVFDWMRTRLDLVLPDGSTTLALDDAALGGLDLSRGTEGLPGWSTSYSADELARLLDAWRPVSPGQLWDNLGYFLERVVPVAARAGVRMALHPDDPPWPIMGLPRIITGMPALRRQMDLVDSPSNGVTFCTGSLGALAENDLPAMVREVGARGRLAFMHCRNVRRTGPRTFLEVPHPSRCGDVDMRAVLDAARSTGYRGPVRPDHGRMIWGETGRPGYGLFDRALGATYLQGVWEGLAGTGVAA